MSLDQLLFRAEQIKSECDPILKNRDTLKLIKKLSLNFQIKNGSEDVSIPVAPLVKDQLTIVSSK
ncbi:unnamed protein product [Allacma fusca]|uniref:Uncharacterized protein n=1 Tax=Allacma fusca TaxID=39272 RepID=A0A8J2K929_9HEXA|nr:unnamed protein product [Allacma fusca]